MIEIGSIRNETENFIFETERKGLNAIIDGVK